MKKPQVKSINYLGIFNSIVVAFFFITFKAQAQVGIGTTNPNATLDIRSSNQVTPANTDGILIPKMNNFPTTAPTANQDGMLVFVTGNGTPNRGFYYWDNANTSWVLVSASTTGAGNTLDQAYNQGGAGLGKNINATNGAVRINGYDGFLVTGEVFYGNPIDTEISGPGTRMFFNPLMSAFRAGSVFDIYPLTGDEWDVANTGLYSAAFGLNTKASGLASTAFGSIASATGGQSTAFGSATTASGSVSTAFGFNTNASGSHSVAFGYEANASGGSSIAFGSFTSASEVYATAFGYLSSASGNKSIAFGYQTNATEDRSTAFGSDTTASGVVSTAFGIQTEASGHHATAFGNNSEATGGIATAFGFNTNASGYCSTAYGIGTIAPSSYEIALGMYNTSYTPLQPNSGFNIQDRLFVIGNGLDNINRRDVVTIYKNGLIHLNDNVGIGTNLPTANLSVNGTANKPGGGTWAVFSDSRLKENIRDYTEGLELINKIRPVSFSYNSKMENILGNSNNKNKTYQGVIAQELQEIAPDMVREVSVNSESYLEVDPNKFTYALINAVKEQQQTIKSQNTKIECLEKLLQKQQKEIEAIKNVLKQ